MTRLDPWFDKVPDTELEPIIEDLLTKSGDGTLFSSPLLRFKFRKTLENYGLAPDDKPASFAQIAKLYGYEVLSHWTGKDNALKILQNGSIKNSAEAVRYPGQFSKPSVFLQLDSPIDHKVQDHARTLRDVSQGRPYRVPSRSDHYHRRQTPGTVTFFFPAARLDTDNWFRANPSWIHGHDTPLSSPPTNMFALVLQLGYSNNEIVFSNSFKVNGLPFFAETDHDTRDALLQDLRDKNIPAPKGLKWEDIIRISTPGNTYEDASPTINDPEVKRYNLDYAPFPD